MFVFTETADRIKGSTNPVITILLIITLLIAVMVLAVAVGSYLHDLYLEKKNNSLVQEKSKKRKEK